MGRISSSHWMGVLEMKTDGKKEARSGVSAGKRDLGNILYVRNVACRFSGRVFQLSTFCSGYFRLDALVPK